MNGFQSQTGVPVSVTAISAHKHEVCWRNTMIDYTDCGNCITIHYPDHRVACLREAAAHRFRHEIERCFTTSQEQNVMAQYHMFSQGIKDD